MGVEIGGLNESSAHIGDFVEPSRHVNGDDVEIVAALCVSKAAQQRLEVGAARSPLVDDEDARGVVHAAPQQPVAELLAVFLGEVDDSDQLFVLDVLRLHCGGVPPREVERPGVEVAPAQVAARVTFDRDHGQRLVLEEDTAAADLGTQHARPPVGVDARVACNGGGRTASSSGVAMCGAEPLQVRPPATDDVGGEAQLPHPRLQVLGPHRRRGEAVGDVQQFCLALGADRDDALLGVNDVAEVLEDGGGSGLFLGVAPEPQPPEDRQRDLHATAALRRGVADDEAVIDVHRALDAQRGQELDHLA